MTRRVIPERDLIIGKVGFELGIVDDPTIELVPITVDDSRPDDVVDQPAHGDEGHA